MEYVKLRAVAFLLAVYFCAAQGQTTEGIILGRVTDELTGQPIPLSKIEAVHRDTGARFKSVSRDGSYTFVRLPPGLYDISVEIDDRYRPARVDAVNLPVAGFIRQDVAVRLITDIWQQNLMRSVVARDQRTVLRFYGPDVDLSRSLAVEAAGTVQGGLEPAISQVVSPGLLETVPLAGRDVYQLITLMPGAAAGLPTLRGAAVAINGQRPSSSNFLLDGVENNNYLITGPFAPLPPEAVEQYRVSTNNFSAEYGRTSG